MFQYRSSRVTLYNRNIMSPRNAFGADAEEPRAFGNGGESSCFAPDARSGAIRTARRCSARQRSAHMKRPPQKIVVTKNISSSSSVWGLESLGKTLTL